MTIPYTYLIKCMPENKVYYGVRYAAGCEPGDLWNSYFTSSKEVLRLIEKYGKDSFEHEIRKTFSDINSARIWENKVLKKMKVIADSRFINQTDNISISSEAAGNAMRGKFGTDHNRFGKKNEFLTNYNKNNPRTGNLNGMFGKTGEQHPGFGKRGKDSPLYGRSRDDLKETLECPHCHKVGNKPNMTRWHFDNCKLINN